MKSILFAALLIFPSFSNADTIVESIRSIKTTKSVPVELLSFVSSVKPEDRVGYGLCMAADRSVCDVNASVGYGLCMAADRSVCDVQGSIGYGLCMAADRSVCDRTGSIGYGLCMAADRSHCSR